MHKKFVLSAILILALASVTQASLVGYWKMDDGSGTVATDTTSNGRNGTLTGSATWAAGKLGGAVKLDGTDSCYVNLPIGPLIQSLADKCTFAVWTNWGGTSGAWSRIWDFGNGTGTGYMFLCANAGSATGPLRFAITQTSNGGETQTNHTTTLPTGWHHVALTMDHATSTVKLLLDGVTVGTSTTTTLTPSSLGSTTQNYLGKSQWADPYWDGLLDDFRIYDEALTEADIQKVMTGYSPFGGTAAAPSPADKATEVLLDAVLSWKPGQGAGKHDVYLGTSFDDVNAASTSSPLCVGNGQDANSYDPPGRLEYGTTYYWRVDETNTVDGKVTPGEIWNFKTELLAYPIASADIIATASSVKSAAEGPDKTIDGSGMADDLADVNSKAMWMSLSTKKGGTMPAWIEYNFDKLYKLHEMWVWNYNGSSELDMGAGAKGTKIEYLSADDQWTTLGDFEFAQGIAEDGYAHNTTVPFGGVAAKAVRLTVNETWGYEFQTGLSEVRFLYLPVWAKEPKPASDSTNIDPTTVVLTWRSGREASSHDVYVGTDANALTKKGTAPTNSFTPAGLELGTQYYWRIDEVNQTTTPTTWAGDVWNFTTPAFLVVDDMESYNATDVAIFDTWVDGYGTSTNGSQVGYGQPANDTFCETVTTHGGKQAMPFLYGRDGITTSEATRTYATAQNWKAAGVKTLTLWFYGAAENGATSLYLKINDTKIAYNGAAGNIQSRRWNQWNIDLTTVAAAGAVTKLILGVTGSGSGTLLIDDLRLYKDAPAVLPPVDPGTNGLVSYFNMEGGKVADSVSGITAANLNATTFVDSATTALGKALMCTGGTTAETTQFVDIGATYWDKVVSKLSNCTFSVWTNYTGVGNIWQRVFDFGSGQNANCYITTGGAVMGVPQFAVKTGVANSGSTATGNVETLVRGRTMWVGWHHLAGVVDNSGAYPTISIYVDGVLSGGPVAGRLPKDMTLQTAWQNYLGKSQWPDPYLNGAVDELRVFNRVLTSGEISYLAGDR